MELQQVKSPTTANRHGHPTGRETKGDKERHRPPQTRHRHPTRRETKGDKWTHRPPPTRHRHPTRRDTKGDKQRHRPPQTQHRHPAPRETKGNNGRQVHATTESTLRLSMRISRARAFHATTNHAASSPQDACVVPSHTEECFVSFLEVILRSARALQELCRSSAR